MIYLIAADVVVFIHLLWIVFLIFGAFIGWKYLWIKRTHITGLTFAFIIQIFGWYCPLTYLEVWLRRLHDPAMSYSGSFIGHYIEKIVYIEMSPKVILVLTVILVFLSAYVYITKSKKRRETR